MSYDIFVSYSRRDNEQGRVAQLVEQIKQGFASYANRELVPFFDQQEIHGMQDWRQRILQGLRESRLLLSCLSPSYLKSEYCRWEFVEYLKYEVGHVYGFNGVAPIYLVEVPGWHSGEFEQHCAAWITELRKRQYFDLRTWYEEGEEALRQAAMQKRMEELKYQIVETIQRGERAEKSLGNIDAHNPHFIGRTEDLRKLRENFVKPGYIGVVTALNGVAGLGKTALAIEYAHAFADEYGGGRWQVRCGGKDNLGLAFAELATPIGFEFTDDERKNADLQFERTCRELKKLAEAGKPHRCLLVLDGVDRPAFFDPAQVARLNSCDWLHVLATTRLGRNELHGAHRDRSFLAIDELTSDDALALIESYQPDGSFANEREREAAHEITQLLGCFTLAVESAAVYLGQFANDVTCTGFLARLKREGLQGLDTAASQSTESVLHGEKRLSVTLQPTLDRLDVREKLALEFAALLAPDHVPLAWLRILVAKMFPDMERDAEPGYPDPWKNVLHHLFSLRLVQVTDVPEAGDQPRTARIHQLVQSCAIQDLIRQEGGTDKLSHLHKTLNTLVLERAVAVRNANRPSDVRWELLALDSLAWWWANAHPLPQLDVTDTEPSGPWITSNPYADVAGFLGFVGMRWGDVAEWSRSEAALRKALAIDEIHGAPANRKITVNLTNLGQLLHDTNRLGEAEQLMRQALALDEKTFGENHPTVIVPLNNLGRLLRDKGMLDDAELLLRRAIAIGQQNLGNTDQSIVATVSTGVPAALSNLAQLLQDRGRFDEAMAIMVKAVDFYARLHGEHHPSVALALNNLAALLFDMNRISEAETLMRQALAIDESLYGSDHPNVARDIGGLGGMLFKGGRLSEAEALFKRCLGILESNEPEKQPNYAATLNSLAALFEYTNRVSQAEPLARRALAINIYIHGRNHPEVAYSLAHLAKLLLKMNRHGDAELHIRQALAINEHFYGPDHAAVANDLSVLAGLLQALNRRAEAERLMRRAVAIDEKILGPEHGQTARDVNNLAWLLKEMNRPTEAEPLMRQALAIAEKHMGPDHTDTAICLNNLALLLQDLGRLPEAESLSRRQLQIFFHATATNGFEHPNLQTAIESYKHLLRAKGLSKDDVLRQINVLGEPYGICLE